MSLTVAFRCGGSQPFGASGASSAGFSEAALPFALPFDLGAASLTPAAVEPFRPDQQQHHGDDRGGGDQFGDSERHPSAFRWSGGGPGSGGGDLGAGRPGQHRRSERDDQGNLFGGDGQAEPDRQRDQRLYDTERHRRFVLDTFEHGRSFSHVNG